MERQTLQQQTPIYHVCQECGGEGCAACSDLCILEGEIELDPELDDELPSVTPINGVIGIMSYPLFGSCPICGEHMEGDGYSTVLHCPNTSVDYDSFEPDANPVYCRQHDEAQS